MTLDWRFAGLLLFLVVVNHAAGQFIAAHTARRLRQAALAAALVSSLGVLAWFKYLNFFAEQASAVLQLFGGLSALPVVEVVLPVGMSFLVFQAVTYPLDLYLGRLQKPSSLPDFLLFMAFFPRLLSGPIVRASFFLPQLGPGASGVDDNGRVEGLVLVMRGLVKKVLLADTLAVAIVDPVFANPGLYSAGYVALGIATYSLQVYLDLSGYTDMAMGVARLFGYRLPANFNRPYLATSVSDFWRRWHITMSSFFRDYLYHGLTKGNPGRVHLNLLVVFVVIGLWHGAGWNFVIYGAIHGALVGLEHARKQRLRQRGEQPPELDAWQVALRVLLVFAFVSLTRVLFRCEDLTAAGHISQALLGNGQGAAPPLPLAVFGALLLGVGLHLSPPRWRDRLMLRVSALPGWALGVAFVALCLCINAWSPGARAFIYYQF
jgi:D-alanyl-lipoteichoic acid acyltransferase DltB (MBOAT superfamily)